MKLDQKDYKDYIDILMDEITSLAILILGVAIITSAINNQDYLSYLYFLGAMLAVGIPGLCLATVEAISINYD